MATISNGESGSSVRTKLNEIINKVEGVTSIDNDIDVTGTVTADDLTVDDDNATITIKSFRPKLILDDDSAVGAGSDKLIIQSASSQSAGDYEFVINNDQTSSTDQVAIKISGNGDISFYEDTGTTAKFFWDASAESLGIGTSSPDAPIHVLLQQNYNGNNFVNRPHAIIDNGTISNHTAVLVFNSSGADSANKKSGITGGNYFSNNHGLAFFGDISGKDRSATPDVFIDSSGNVLVGTTSAPNGTSAYGSGFVGETNSRSVLRLATSSTAQLSVARFYNPNGQVGEIKTDGTSTLYVTSSDYRLKENVVELTGATDRLKQLEPKRFNFIADADTTVDGFLAHEVQSVVPEAITGTHNEVDADGNPVYQGIDQSKLVPLLVATIKELEARITALENG